MFKWSRSAVVIYATALLLVSRSVGGVNLFQQDKEAAKKKTPCEEPILKAFEALNGTGAQSYEVDEDKIQLCPNLCGNSTILSEFCSRKEADFVAQFGAEVQSDRCCDERRCVCVCHFRCGTLNLKEKEYRGEGYRHCVKHKDREGAIRRATKKCAKKSKKLRCEAKEMNFMCPQQFVCVDKKQCLACVNPNCVTGKDQKITKMVLTAHNQTVQQHATNMSNIVQSEQHLATERTSRNRLRKKQRKEPSEKGNITLGIIV